MSDETKMAGPAGKTAMGEMLIAFEAFKQANDHRLAEIEARQGADPLIEEKLARIEQAMDAMALDAARPDLSETRSAAPGWEGYLRRGDASGLHAGLAEGKSLSSGSPADGGYLAPAQTQGLIDRLTAEVSPIRAIASVGQTSAGLFRKPVSLGGAASGWVAETAARPQTATPQLDLIDFPAAELYAMPAATTTLLDDALVDLDQWLAEEVRSVFAEQESAAFISGDGVNKPRGFLDYPAVDEVVQAWGEVGYVATGVEGGFPLSDPADILLDLIYAPRAGYRARGRFVMNRRTVSAVRKFKDADGNYLWQPSLSEAGGATLMGYPVSEAEDMPDIGADSFAMAFGDFARFYLILDRSGVQVLRDPFSAKPYVLFYVTKRVAGGVQDFNAVKLLKFGVS